MCKWAKRANVPWSAFYWGSGKKKGGISASFVTPPRSRIESFLRGSVSVLLLGGQGIRQGLSLV